MKIALQYYAQYDKFSCGCICTKMLLKRLGILVKREEIIKSMGAKPFIGVETEDIVNYIEKYGLEILQKQNTTIADLIRYIKSGYPVMVNYINPVTHYGHFGIITGFNQKEKVFYFADPRMGQDYGISFGDFEEVWRNRPENSKQVIKWSLVIGRERIILK